MTVSARTIASGNGWRVSDLVCSAGPHDRPFEEQHDAICIAVVTDGTFQYRSSQGSALLAPGALLLGNQGSCYQCGHDHSRGDRCLSFHYDPAFFQSVLSAVPGARRLAFDAARIPPAPALAALAAEAEALREDGDSEAVGEIAVRLAGAAASLLADGGSRRPSPSDERRVAAAIRRIEEAASGPVGLQELAAEAGLSPYHFLRTFREAAGMTPYQYVLRTRLHRAAVRLRATTDHVSEIAYDAGFNDLSTFNRRFKRIMGRAPQAYRSATKRRSNATSRP